MKLIEHFVDGKVIPGTSNKKGKVYNPATGEQEKEVRLASKQDLNQAVLAANAGVTHLLPFCEPFIDVNKDSTELIRELKSTFDGWENRPFITAALVRSVTTAHKAIVDGADGIIIFWPIFEEMIKSKMTDEWNKIFLDNWNDIYDSGNLDDIKYKP